MYEEECCAGYLISSLDGTNFGGDLASVDISLDRTKAFCTMNFQDTQPLAIAELPSLDEAIDAFDLHITKYRSALNTDGVWLFLTSLGCWSAPLNYGFQLVAFAVAGMVFGHRFVSKWPDKTTFAATARKLNARLAQDSIKLEEMVERRKARLAAIALRSRSNSEMFRSGWPFLMCWMYWGLSFSYSGSKFALVIIAKLAA